MAKTADDLISQAASILGIKVAGEPLSSVANDVISGNVDAVIEEVNGIVVIDRDEIDDRYFQTIARLVALHSAPQFSSAAPIDYAAIQQHENRLRYLAAGPVSREPVKTDYF